MAHEIHAQPVVDRMLQAVALFRRGDMTLIALIDRLDAGLRALPPTFRPALGDLEDAWTEMEIIYAQASAAGQAVLTAAEASDLEDAIDRFVAVLTAATRR